MNVHFGGQPHPIDHLPPDVLDAVETKMEQHDLQAHVLFELTCPQCAHIWSAVFDIAAFLWEELDAFAARLLREIHTLASSYSWHESDILGLSPYRRQAYLDLING